MSITSKKGGHNTSSNTGNSYKNIQNEAAGKLEAFRNDALRVFESVEKKQDAVNKKLSRLHCRTDIYELHMSVNDINNKAAIVKFEFLKDGMPQSISSMDIRELLENSSGDYGIELHHIGKLLHWCDRKIGKDRVGARTSEMKQKIYNSIE